MDYRKVAGFKVEKRGPGRPVGKRPDKKELQRLYVREGRSIRDIAGILECSKDVVYRALQEYGLNRRSRARRPRLRQYDLEFLKEKVKKYGVQKAAEDLGVSRHTLWRYLRGKSP